MKNFKKTIMVTGAGRIGSSVASDLIRKGNNVLLGDIDKARLLKIKKLTLKI